MIHFLIKNKYLYIIAFIVLTISSARAEKGIISGHVFEEGSPGAPISELFIICYDFYTDEYVEMGITQPDGSYAIEIPPGDYKVYAQANDLGIYIPEYFGNTFDAYFAKKVSVYSGLTVSNINFELSPGALITGFVYDIDNNPIAYMRIEAYDLEGNLQGYTKSRDNGDYYLHVPGGQYRLRAYATERDYVTVFYNNTYNFFNATVFDVTTGTGYGDYNFYLIAGVKVQGIVTGLNHEPVANVVVWAFSQYEHYAKTQSDGTYEIILPPNNYLFAAESSDYLYQYYDHAYDVMHATVIAINHDIDIGSIDFQLEKQMASNYEISDVIMMLQLLTGFSKHPDFHLNDFDLNENNQVDMMDVLQIFSLVGISK